MDNIPPQLSILPVKNISLCAVSGVYFLIKNGIVVYVGQSENVMGRIAEHSDKDFDAAFYIEVGEENRTEIESKYIIALNPKYNKTHRFTIEFNDLLSRLRSVKLRPYEKHYLDDPRVDPKDKIRLMRNWDQRARTSCIRR